MRNEPAPTLGNDAALDPSLTRPPYSLRRAYRERRDLWVCARFLIDGGLDLPLRDRVHIVRQLYAASLSIDSPHRQEEMLAFMRTILTLPKDVPGVIVEAGAYKGSSTAKFSIAAALAGRELVVFDSFQGMPANDEAEQRNIFGRPEHFQAGSYPGSLDEVHASVSRFGRLDVCRFIAGWFDDTMPAFKEPVAAVYLDVDLASSTRTCLKYLYPLVQPGGSLFSQDGHLRPVIEVLRDRDFWLREIGCTPPHFEGLGHKKLVWTKKEAGS